MAANQNFDRLVQPLAHALEYYERKQRAASWRDSAKLQQIVLDYYDLVLGLPKPGDMTAEDVAQDIDIYNNRYRPKLAETSNRLTRRALERAKLTRLLAP